MVAGAGVVVKLERDNRERIREKRAPIAAMDASPSKSGRNFQGAHIVNPFKSY